MAYLKSIARQCQSCERKPATVELMGRSNDSYGLFCAKCGEQQLKRIQASENASFPSSSTSRVRGDYR